MLRFFKKNISSYIHPEINIVYFFLLHNNVDHFICNTRYVIVSNSNTLCLRTNKLIKKYSNFSMERFYFSLIKVNCQHKSIFTVKYLFRHCHIKETHLTS